MRLIITILSMGLPMFPANAAEPVLLGYFPEWAVYDRGYHVSAIPAAKLTHICYAFAKIERGEIAIVDRYAALEKTYPGDPPADGEIRGNFRQLQLLKQKHPHVKTLISVGGWTLSSPFSDVALTAESRQRFAASCVKFIQQYGFDGVDLDWEYPVSGGLEGNRNRPEDRANYVLLLAELRKQLDAVATKAKPTLLTIASPVGSWKLPNFDLPGLAKHVDWFNVMAYDLAGGWDKSTGLLANLFAKPGETRCVDTSIMAYLKAGVLPEKIVLGVPLYGRGWAGVPATNQGLYQVAKGPAPKGTWETGMWDYQDLVRRYIKPGLVYRQESDQSPWVYDPKTGILISYEDEQSLRVKGRYVRDKKLRGFMCWELSADDPKQPLISILAEEVKKR